MMHWCRWLGRGSHRVKWVLERSTYLTWVCVRKIGREAGDFNYEIDLNAKSVCGIPIRWRRMQKKLLSQAASGSDDDDHSNDWALKNEIENKRRRGLVITGEKYWTWTFDAFNRWDSWRINERGSLIEAEEVLLKIKSRIHKHVAVDHDHDPF